MQSCNSTHCFTWAYETFSIAINEKRKMRKSEIKVRRRIFGPKKKKKCKYRIRNFKIGIVQRILLDGRTNED